MGYRQHPDVVEAARERAGAGHFDVPVAALEALVRVAGERAGQEPRLGEDLEPVANAEHVPAALRVRADGPENRAHFGDGAGTKVVPVAESAGDRDEVRPRGKLRVRMPGDVRLEAAHVAERVDHLGIGIGSGEDDDASAHGGRS